MACASSIQKLVSVLSSEFYICKQTKVDLFNIINVECNISIKGKKVKKKKKLQHFLFALIFKSVLFQIDVNIYYNMLVNV